MLKSGAPHAAVLAAAGEINAGLLVAGALEKDGITKEIFGSTARRVARRVHCPLFLFTEPVVGGTPYRRIAVSTQTDQPTARALDFTLELARRAATEEIHVLHEKNYFDRLASRYASESYEARLARPPAPPELQTFLEGFDFGRAALKIQELEDGEGIAAVEHGRRHQTDLLVYPAPSRPLTFWDRFFNHPVELVLGRLPSALLIHRCPTGQAERGPRA
jgi:hypothetical protein